MATLEEIVVADDPSAWEKLGFDVRGDRCQVGPVAIRFVEEADESGIQSLGLSGLASGDFGGLKLTHSEAADRQEAGVHPNGVEVIDHVVAFSWQFDETAEVLDDAGLNLRWIRNEPTPAGAPRQAFFMLDTAVLELVQGEGEVKSTRFWGLAFAVNDLDRLVATYREVISGPRPAVQPERRIATLRRQAGLAVPIAFMTPRR